MATRVAGNPAKSAKSASAKNGSASSVSGNSGVIKASAPSAHPKKSSASHGQTVHVLKTPASSKDIIVVLQVSKKQIAAAKSALHSRSISKSKDARKNLGPPTARAASNSGKSAAKKQ